MKKQGTQDFKTIDAFSSIKDNKFIIECNYCDHYAENEETALQHYDNIHADIREKFYPKSYLDKQSGKRWFIPKQETIEHSKYMLNDVDFYLKFYGSCAYNDINLTAQELKNVHQNPTSGFFFYKEDPTWELENSQQSVSFKKEIKKTKNHETETTIEDIIKRITSLEERVNRMSSQPKSVFSPKKQYRIYSLNVGETKIEKSKDTIRTRYHITDESIIVKPNKFGNFSIFYKPKEQQ